MSAAKKPQMTADTPPLEQLRAVIDAALRVGSTETQFICRDVRGQVISVAVCASGKDAVALERWLTRRGKAPW